MQVDASLTLTDPDSASLSHATVSLTGGSFRSGEDVLAFVNTNSALYGNIVSSWNASTGVLTLTSSGSLATVAQWEAALRAVTYHDSSTMPYQGDRTITFVVNDGTSDSSPVSKIMKILPNSPPVIGNLERRRGDLYRERRPREAGRRRAGHGDRQRHALTSTAATSPCRWSATPAPTRTFWA